MRLVIDLQGAQGASRLRGIGRYSRELALAMARAPQGHEVVLALNASLPCDELVDAFSPHLPAANIRLWHGPGGTGAVIGAGVGGAAGSVVGASVTMSI
jgi:glycosyltransferase involved in cell wall biosynthesis